jgi:hypothetical protein
MADTAKNEIQYAIQRLGLSESDIKLLSDQEGLKVFSAALSHFVASGDRRWWWEDFRFPSTSVRFADQKGFERIDKVVPNKKERVWFIVEDDQLPFYPVYEGTPEAIQAVIGECYGFEYYLVAKDLSWLICETHHDDMIAIGTEVEEHLRQLDG